jgi:16S rRNA (uracil1498-N3)-methyltransferase
MADDFPSGSDFFYTPPDHIYGEYLEIDGDEFGHLSHVMRKKAGEEFVVVDGMGYAYRVQIDSIDRRSARCLIKARKPGLHEPTRKLTFGIGLLKHPAAMDYVVEKLTELGVGTIMPLITTRTITRHARTERWQKLALAAMKQSGRCLLPTVMPALSFADALRESATSAARLIPHETVRTPHIMDCVKGGEPSACVLIGPEGGFTEEEIAEAQKAGCVPVTLGERRLRAETAAVVAAAFVMQG